MENYLNIQLILDHIGMIRMRKGSWQVSLTLAFILAISAFMVIQLEETMGESTHDTRLYLHKSPRMLKTQPPQLSPGDESLPQTMVVGALQRYEMPYPVTDNLILDGPIDSGMTIITLHLEGSFVTPSSSGVVLSVELIEKMKDGGEDPIGSLELEQDELGADDFNIPISGDDELQPGSNLILELNITEGTGPLGTTNVFNFQYSNLAGGHSYLEFLCDPIPDNGITMKMLDQEGNPISGILPNGPPETRTVKFVCGVRDLFGAYDVASVNLKVTSPNGSLLLNLTEDQLDNDGGQEWAYYNETEELPESLPVGTYDVIVTGRSHTGYNKTEIYGLEVSEGLHVSLMGDDLIEADAGETLQIPVKVINGGGSNDRISFDHSGGVDWRITAPSDADIEAGSSKTFDYLVTVPIDSLIGDSREITLIIESRNAGEDYNVVVMVEVATEATFGIEVVGEDSRALNPGMSASFSVMLVNLRNETKTFELEDQGLPAYTDLSLTAPGGEQQGSYYNVEVPPDEEVSVSVNVTVGDSTPGGAHQFMINARVQGGDETRSVYLNILVVDPSKDVLSVPSGVTERTATRSGSVSPIEYSDVVFGLTLYNPTLDEVDLSVSVDVLEGWTYDSDYSSAVLQPGTGSSFNVSVKPAAGEIYDGGDGYDVVVSVSGSGLRESKMELTVKLPEIRGVELTVEEGKEVVEVASGGSARVNMTLKNDGNRVEDVQLSSKVLEMLTVSMDPETVDQLEPGQEVRIEVNVEVGEISSNSMFQVDVEADMTDYTSEASFQVRGTVSDSSSTISPVLMVVIVLAVIVVLAAVILGYLRMSKKKPGKKTSDKKKESPSKPDVTVKAEDEKIRPSRAVRPPPDHDVLDEADQVTREILGDDEGSEKVAEPETVQATVLE